MADPYTFTFDVEALLSGQDVVEEEAPKEGVMKRPVKEAEAKTETPTESIKTRLANALKTAFPNSSALGTAPQGDTSVGRNKALTDWTVSTEAFIPKYRGDVPAAAMLDTPPVSTTDLGPDMGTLSMQDAQEQAAIRSVSGITESLGRSAPEVMPAEPDTPATQGLMSPPVQDTVSEVDTDTAEPVAEEGEQYSEVTTSLRPQLRNDRKVTLSRLGSSFGDASRDDIKVLQTVLKDMAGPSEVEVGRIDGQWGTKGRNALWAFQLRSGIDPTGEMNEETATALNGPSDSLDPRQSKINVDSLQEPASKMLVGVEALKLMPYELNSNRLGRSGITFGAGIDVGQHSAAYLKRNFNFTDEMVDEFGVYDAETNPEGWIGRNPASPTASNPGQGGDPGTPARNRVHAEMSEEYRRQREAGELPVVAEKWILENIKPVYDEYVGKPKVKYDSLYGRGSWGELPEEAQAIAVLENYRGDGVNSAQLRLLREGDFFGAARAAKKSSRSPAMIKVLRELGYAE